MDRLEELNPSAEWCVYERPFRHIRAEQVFRKEIYQRIEGSFLGIRDNPRGNTGGEAGFRKSSAAYDALIFPMSRSFASGFAPFFERRWIDFLAHLLNLPALEQIDGALHHIPINSRSGWIHNDFCSGWFNARDTGDIVLPDRGHVDYFTGASKSSDAKPKEFVRAATMIFYLQNDEWKEGCGGETGLYPCSRSGRGEMCLVPPSSNSLLLFECSPHSYHSLLGNPGCPRNSIILWLHSSLDNAQSRWGRAFTRRRPR
jgi:hypothetical protein